MSDFPRPFRWRDHKIALVVAALGVAAIPFANKTHYLIYHALNVLPLTSFLLMAVQTVSWGAIAMIIWLIWIFDPRRRKAIIYLLVAFEITSNANGLIKQVAGRARPSMTLGMTERQRGKIENFIKMHPGTPIKITNSDEWIFMSRGRPIYLMDGFVSFPSGHAATAFTLAAFLLVLYPRGRVVWFVLAVGCAAARVRFRRHFLEDVMFGGATGWIVSSWVYSWKWPSRVADWAEQKFFPRGL